MLKRVVVLILINFLLFIPHVNAASCTGSPVYAKDSNGTCCLKKYLQDNGSCNVKDVSLDANSKKLSCSSDTGRTTYYYPSIKYTNYVANEYFYNEKTVIEYDDECTFYVTEKIDISYPKQNLVEAGRGVVLTITIVETKSYYPSSNACSNKLSNYVKKVQSELDAKIIVNTDVNNFQVTSNTNINYSELSSSTEYLINGDIYDVKTTKVYDVPGYIVVSGTGQVISNDSANAIHKLYTKFTLNTKIYNLDLIISNFTTLVPNRYLYLDCDYKILSKYYKTSDTGIVDKKSVNYFSRNISLTDIFPKRAPAANWAGFTDLIEKIESIGNGIYNQEALYKTELTASTIKSIRSYNDKYSYTEFRKEFTRQYYSKS